MTTAHGVQPGLGWPHGSAGRSPAAVVDAASQPTTGLGWPTARASTVPAQPPVSRETWPPPGAGPFGPAPAPGTREHPSTGGRAGNPPASNDSGTLLGTAAERRVRAAYESGHRPALPRPEQPRVLAVANQKGGVGKTTTAVNLAAALAQHGARVLLLDLDPQGNASTALGIDHTHDVAGVYEALVDGTPLGELIRGCPDLPGLSVVPATIDLAGAEIELVSLPQREGRLRDAVEGHLTATAGSQQQPDYVFIDCPPSLGLLTVNALVAGHELLVPIQCEYYALEGVGQLLRNVDLIRSHLNPVLTVSTLLLTMYDARTRLSAAVAEEIRTHFGDRVLRTTIPRSVRISEAPSYSQTVMTYDPSSPGALCYLEAARELAQQNVARPPPEAS